MKKQILASLLALLMLSSAVSCSDSGETAKEDPAAGEPANSSEPETEAETEAPETQVTDDLPELTFEKEFNMISPTLGHCTSFVFTEELTGDNVNDARYGMKLAVEDLMGLIRTDSGES